MDTGVQSGGKSKYPDNTYNPSNVSFFAQAFEPGNCENIKNQSLSPNHDFLEETDQSGK